MKTCKKTIQEVCGITEVKIALFGDENGGKGLIKKVDEMHEVFTNTKWTTKIVLGIFAGVGIITGGIIGMIELLRRVK